MPRRVLPFFRKQSTRMNCSIWILPGITENSIQMVSALNNWWKSWERFCWCWFRVSRIHAKFNGCNSTFSRFKAIIFNRLNVISYPLNDFAQPFNILTYPFTDFARPFNVSSYPFKDFAQPFNVVGFPFKILFDRLTFGSNCFWILLERLTLFAFRLNGNRNRLNAGANRLLSVYKPFIFTR